MHCSFWDSYFIAFHSIIIVKDMTALLWACNELTRVNGHNYQRDPHMNWGWIQVTDLVHCKDGYFIQNYLPYPSTYKVIYMSFSCWSVQDRGHSFPKYGVMDLRPVKDIFFKFLRVEETTKKNWESYFTKSICFALFFKVVKLFSVAFIGRVYYSNFWREGSTILLLWLYKWLTKRENLLVYCATFTSHIRGHSDCGQSDCRILECHALVMKETNKAAMSTFAHECFRITDVS